MAQSSPEVPGAPEGRVHSFRPCMSKLAVPRRAFKDAQRSLLELFCSIKRRLIRNHECREHGLQIVHFEGAS